MFIRLQPVIILVVAVISFFLLCMVVIKRRKKKRKMTPIEQFNEGTKGSKGGEYTFGGPEDWPPMPPGVGSGGGAGAP